MKRKVLRLYDVNNKSEKYKKVIQIVIAIISVSIVLCTILFGLTFCMNNQIYDKISNFFITILLSLSIGLITGLIIYILPVFKEINIQYIEENLINLEYYKKNLTIVASNSDSITSKSATKENARQIKLFIEFLNDYFHETSDLKLKIEILPELFGNVFKRLIDEYIRGEYLMKIFPDKKNLYSLINEFLELEKKIDIVNIEKYDTLELNDLIEIMNRIVEKILSYVDDTIYSLRNKREKLK